MSSPALEPIGIKEPNEADEYRARLYRSYRTDQVAIDISEERASRAPYLRAVIRKYFPANREAKILDVGCGAGLLLYFLREAGYTRLWGIDTSPEQVQDARNSGFEQVERANALEFLGNTADRSFEVIVAFDIIEHLTGPELLRLADEIHRVLSDGGLWLIHAPNAEGFFGNRIRYADLTHEQAFTRESIHQLSRAAGFSETKCFEDSPVAHGLKSMLRLVSWKAMRIFLRVYRLSETGETNGIFSQNLLAYMKK